MPSPRIGDRPARRARSMLFVPATRWEIIVKAAASAADSVCIDLEDSVPVEGKASARANVIRAFGELDFGGRTRMVRVNAVNTPYHYQDVIDVVEALGDGVDLIMLPKAGSPHDVRFLDTLLTQIEVHRGRTRRIGIEAQIETAGGFLSAREIAQSSQRLEALIFGPGDYSASMRMPSAAIGTFDTHDALYPGHRWHAVMHGVVAAARANGLRCVDGPYATYGDAPGFERACHIARAMGFDGKQCIHPMQLPVVNAIFSPTPEEIARAQRVVDACDAAERAGIGVATLDGSMIDAASARMARVVLEQREQP